MLRKKVAIDLGTANTLVWVSGRGIILNEPTVVAISADDNKVIAVGNHAKRMLGRNPESLVVSRPMRDGVIADYQVTEAMLGYFISEACRLSDSKGDSEKKLKSSNVASRGLKLTKLIKSKFQFIKPDVMVCVPAGCTQVESRAALDATLSAGAAHAYLIDEPLVAAIGAGIPVSAPTGHMILDMGGGAAEAAVISLGGVVINKSVRIAGNKIDESIQAYLRKNYNLIVGDQTAEEIKIRMGVATEHKEEKKLEVSGRDLVFGLPRSVVVSSKEITEAIKPTLTRIVGVVKAVLEDTPPELAADIIDRGIVMSGGTSTLRNFDKFITEETGVPAHVAEDPMYCVVKGTGIVMDNLDLWKRSITSKK
jgi:rod shape-determining protein MreB